MVVLAPWQSYWPSGVIFVVLGIWGLIYRIYAVRARSHLHLKAIKSKIDRISHNVITIVASVFLISGGAGLTAGEAFAPLAIAGSTTLLLFVTARLLPRLFRVDTCNDVGGGDEVFEEVAPVFRGAPRIGEHVA